MKINLVPAPTKQGTIKYRVLSKKGMSLSLLLSFGFFFYSISADVFILLLLSLPSIEGGSSKNKGSEVS